MKKDDDDLEVRKRIAAGLAALRDDLDRLRAMQAEHVAGITDYTPGGWSQTAIPVARCPGCKQPLRPLSPDGDLCGCGCPSVRWQRAGDWYAIKMDETDPS